MRRTRLQELVEGGSRRARTLRALREQPERFLATVQVGITVLSATAAAFSGASIAARIQPSLARIEVLEPYAEELAFSIVVAAVSFLSLVLGELVPKSLALRASESYALLLAPVLLGLSWVARPLVWLLTTTSNLVLRPFGDRTTFTEARHSPEELQQLLEESAKAGTVDKQAGEIATRALELPGLTAFDVMVPRNRIVGVPRHASQDQLREVLLEQGHSRMPVYQDTLDHIVGYVTAKDALSFALDRQLIVLDDLVRPVYFVPEATPALLLLRELQVRRTPLAIVVDEHGGVSGLVTLEDVLEELVGEIYSEGQQVQALFKPEPDGSFVAHAHAPIRELNRALAIELPEGDGYSTIGGLVMTLAGRVPEKGYRTDAEGVMLEVLEASPHVVRLVRLIRPAPAGSELTPLA